MTEEEKEIEETEEAVETEETTEAEEIEKLLENMAMKGARKYGAKIPSMKRSYRAAEPRAKAGYDATPFGPTRKANYKAAWEYMPDNYDTIVKPGLETKWKERWVSKMKE